ncbi:hypothetical protein BDQ17DRAFT_1242532 [Cyathus striatus]|nr:hypothetical protein BDQ17DRAFT_1242532 [Cyathus striatus]
MYEDESDLTDLTDELDETPKTKPKKPKTGAKKDTSSAGGYRIRNALKVPRATTYTAQALYDQIHGADINLEPEYQRDVVWPEAKQIGIIDSIFRNFYIPPVIFAVNSFEDGSENKTCIDGKQRLTSIYRMVTDDVDRITGEKLWYKDVGTGANDNKTASASSARAKKVLPEKYRRLFANKQIVCVEYQDITDGDEREIFQRVQLGMALTPAEKLQVINTSRAAFIRELQQVHLREEGGLSADHLEWDRSRGADFRCLANSVWCMEKWDNGAPKNAGTMLQLERWLAIEDQLPDPFIKKVESAFEVFSELVQNKKYNKLFTKLPKVPSKVSPVEFVMIALLLYVHGQRLDHWGLAHAIGGMRENVRDVHVDIRMNNRVAKTMIDYIADMEKDAGGVTNGKRKRVDEDEDEEYEVPLAKSRAKGKGKEPEPQQPAPKASTPSVPLPRPNRMAALRAAKSALPPRTIVAATGETPRVQQPTPPPPPTPVSAPSQTPNNQQEGSQPFNRSRPGSFSSQGPPDASQPQPRTHLKRLW